MWISFCPSEPVEPGLIWSRIIIYVLLDHVLKNDLGDTECRADIDINNCMLIF